MSMLPFALLAGVGALIASAGRRPGARPQHDAKGYMVTWAIGDGPRRHTFIAAPTPAAAREELRASVSSAAQVRITATRASHATMPQRVRRRR